MSNGMDDQPITFLSVIENTISELLVFIPRFLWTLWMIVVRPRSFGQLLLHPEHRKRPIAPFTFLVVSALPGGVMLKIVSKCLSHGYVHPDDVGAGLVEFMSADSFSLTSVILLSLPIVVVAAAFGYLLAKQYAGDSSGSQKDIISVSCYAFGFSMLCTAFSVLVPLVLIHVIHSDETTSLGIVYSRTPEWTFYSGIPFYLLAVTYTGHILSSGIIGTDPPVKSPRLTLNCHAAAIIGYVASFWFIFMLNGIDWSGAVSAKSSQTVNYIPRATCRGEFFKVDPKDGHFSWSILINNDSANRSLFITKQKIKIDMGNTTSTDVKVIDWGAGNNSEMEIRPLTDNWMRLSGHFSKDDVHEMMVKARAANHNISMLNKVNTVYLDDVESGLVFCIAHPALGSMDKPVVLIDKGD